MSECRVVSKTRKIIGGKMIRVEAEICDEMLKNIVISGDFFAHPEHVIDEIEEELKGRSIREVLNIVEGYRDRVVFTGLSFDDLVLLLREIIES